MPEAEKLHMTFWESPDHLIIRICHIIRVFIKRKTNYHSTIWTDAFRNRT